MFPLSNGNAIASGEPTTALDEPTVAPGELATAFDRKSILDNTIVMRDERCWMITADSPVVQFLLLNRRRFNLTPQTFYQFTRFSDKKPFVVIDSQFAAEAYHVLVRVCCNLSTINDDR